MNIGRIDTLHMTHTVNDRCPHLLSLMGDFASFCLIISPIDG